MNLDLEQTFIAELILQNKEIPQIRVYIPDGSFFEDSICSKYYEAILSTYDVEGTVDLVLVGEELKLRNLSDVDLMRWTNEVSGFEKIGTHAKKIAERYMKRIGSRSLIELHKDFQDNPDPLEAIDNTISALAHLRLQFKKDHAVSMATIAGETCEEIEKLRKGINTCLPFGFVDLDNTTGGMDAGELIVIAGLAKRGKTTLALQSLFCNAQNKIPILFFSTEMKRKQIMFRYAFIVERLSWIDAKHNKLTATEWDRLVRRVNIIGSYPVYVRDNMLTISDIIAESERFVNDRGVKLIVVDYIQRVVPINKRSNENREREIASISSGLKNIAMNLNVPVIALSQLNDDLRARESRAIEQDMDKMIIINSEDKDELTADGKGATIGVKIWQRMGMSGGFNDSKLFYDRMHGSWKSYLNEDRNDEPQETQTSF